MSNERQLGRRKDTFLAMEPGSYILQALKSLLQIYVMFLLITTKNDDVVRQISYTWNAMYVVQWL